MGDLRKALDNYEQRLAIAREISDLRGEAMAMWNMALVFDQLGQRATAIVSADAALTIREQIGDPNAAAVRKKLAEWRGDEELRDAQPT